MILNAIADCKNQIAKESEDNDPKLQLADSGQDIFVQADKGGINQAVWTTLLNLQRPVVFVERQKRGSLELLLA
jgi:hypothetical protein